MSAIANTPHIQNNTPRVTSISTNARIEYIMRFSEHAVLVVDNSSDLYSSIGHQFIGALDENNNAAFISLSPKLNDIQIRCRLVEQLFSDTLFDPEEPLAVTVLKLASDKKQPISIIIEHAHFLSLQLMHEFCQLANVASKGQRTVNVLLLGEERTGKIISENTEVFNDKLSILNANDGQLIPNDASMFTPEKVPVMFTPARKFALGIIAVSLLSCLLIVSLYQSDTFTYTDITPAKKTLAITPETRITNQNVAVNQQASNIPQAGPNDVLQALSFEGNNSAQFITKAQPADVMDALMGEASHVQAVSEQANVTLTPLPTNSANTSMVKPSVNSELTPELTTKVNPSVKQDVIITQSNQVTEPPSFAEEISFTESGASVNNHNSTGASYYENFSQGFVVQIVGFSKHAAYQDFLTKYQEQGFVGYQRILNGKALFVVTTKVYPLKSDAIAAASLLPEALKAQGTWVKSIKAVKRELAEFKKQS